MPTTQITGTNSAGVRFAINRMIGTIAKSATLAWSARGSLGGVCEATSRDSSAALAHGYLSGWNRAARDSSRAIQRRARRRMERKISAEHQEHDGLEHQRRPVLLREQAHHGQLAADRLAGLIARALPALRLQEVPPHRDPVAHEQLAEQRPPVGLDLVEHLLGARQHLGGAIL